MEVELSYSMDRKLAQLFHTLGPTTGNLPLSGSPTSSSRVLTRPPLALMVLRTAVAFRGPRPQTKGKIFASICVPDSLVDVRSQRLTISTIACSICFRSFSSGSSVLARVE